MIRCWRCGGAVIANWEESSCLQCGAGPEPARVAQLVDLVAESQRRNVRRIGCPECGRSIQTTGLGQHRLRHRREEAPSEGRIASMKASEL